MAGWRHMDLGWTGTNQPPAKPGAELCVMAHVLGLLWSCNPLRIIYASERKGPALLPGREALGAKRQPPCTRTGALHILRCWLSLLLQSTQPALA